MLNTKMDYLLNEASYRMTNEDYDQTLEILDVILKKVPKNYRANLYKGQVCVEMKEYEDAIRYFEAKRNVKGCLSSMANIPLFIDVYNLEDKRRTKTQVAKCYYINN